MATFLTILITFLFLAGSFILLKLHNLRKEMYNDINGINEARIKIPKGLTVENIDDNLMKLLGRQVKKEKNRIVVSENETDALTDKVTAVDLKKEPAERKIVVPEPGNDPEIKIQAADNDDAPEVELIKSLDGIAEKHKSLMIDQIESYLINILDEKIVKTKFIKTLNPRKKRPKKIKVEEPVIHQDETEELRRRAMERIAKLRNLSFHINAADPNNEFETVPAYLRRNMELHNSLADIENFYSNYTVKSDENNKAEIEISTINTFLDGKKPD